MTEFNYEDLPDEDIVAYMDKEGDLVLRATGCPPKETTAMYMSKNYSGVHRTPWRPENATRVFRVGDWVKIDF